MIVGHSDSPVRFFSHIQMCSKCIQKGRDNVTVAVAVGVAMVEGMSMSCHAYE